MKTDFNFVLDMDLEASRGNLHSKSSLHRNHSRNYARSGSLGYMDPEAKIFTWGGKAQGRRSCRNTSFSLHLTNLAQPPS